MNQIEPLDKTGYLIVFSILLGLNLVTGSRDLSSSVYHFQCINIICLESIGLPHLFELIELILAARFN